MKVRTQEAQAETTGNERDAMCKQLAEVQLQLRNRERELSDLRKRHKLQVEQLEVDMRDNDQILKTTEIQKTELAACLQHRRTEIAELNQALERERQAAVEAKLE